MTAIGDLPSNKLLSLALHGYNSFQPECGIFCGGYQGLLYPNPTTLVYPGFNPYAFLEATASEYAPDTEYTGLGVGNPGIDYKNPGHILGLLDTFGRMSYGIGSMRSIYNGETDGDISPAVNVSIPMFGISGTTSISMADIYPTFSEIPIDWMNSFTISSDGTVDPDPRPMAGFPSPGGGHTPTLNPIIAELFYPLFADKTVFSYLGMPQYLRSVISALYAVANSLTAKTELEFTLDNPSDFNRYSHQTNWHTATPWQPPGYDLQTDKGIMYVQYKTLSPSQALHTLTGWDNYHDGEDGMNEYRSLTELNSVINLIPVQMVGATYWTDTKGYAARYSPGTGWEYYVGPQTGRGFVLASIMIVDFLINVSDIPVDPDDPEPGTVTVAGEVVLHSPITDPTAYYYTETIEWWFSPAQRPPSGEHYTVTTEYGCIQSLRKSAAISMSMTNQFAWDKTWLGQESVAGGYSTSDSFSDETTSGGSVPGVGFITCDQSDLNVPFSKTFALGAGCTSIRMRVFVQNRHKIGQNSHYAPWNWGPASPGPGIVYQVHASDFSGNPDSVPDDLTLPNMEVSFTVTGTNINSQTYELSI